MHKFTKKTLVVSPAAALLLGGGAAYAYWTTTGTGTGVGATTAGTTSQLTFTQTALTAMYPGDSSQTLTVAVKNNSSKEKTYVTSVKAYITTDKPGCTGADFLLAGVTTGTLLAPTTLTWTAADLAVAAQANATSTIQFNNSLSNQDVQDRRRDDQLRRKLTEAD